MAFNINQFRSNLVGDGARSNLFDVNIVFPAIAQFGAAAGAKTTFMAKSALLPNSSVNPLTLNYFGRELKFAGNRRFTDWTITIINDEDFLIRNALESWMNAMNSNQGNLRDPSVLSSTVGYTQDAVVNQYGKTGNVIKTYNFIGMFPTDVSAINLGWDQDAIEEYEVTFSYQYWTTTGPGGIPLTT